MNVVKIIGLIFLAIFLILNGLSIMSEVHLAPLANYFVNTSAIVAGVLILISIGRFLPSHKEQ